MGDDLGALYAALTAFVLTELGHWLRRRRRRQGRLRTRHSDRYVEHPRSSAHDPGNE